MIGGDLQRRHRFLICSRCARIGPSVARRRGPGGARYAAMQAGWRTASRKGAGTGGGVDLCPTCVEHQELMETAERDMAAWETEHGAPPAGYAWSGQWQHDGASWSGQIVFRGAQLVPTPGYRMETQ